jgi:hypothetical protein
VHMCVVCCVGCMCELVCTCECVVCVYVIGACVPVYVWCGVWVYVGCVHVYL